VIKKAGDTTVEEFQTEIRVFGITLFILIFLWEVTTSGRLHHYQLVIVTALLFFTPVNSTLVTLSLLANLLTRTYFR
jgi:hypothetical protein